MPKHMSNASWPKSFLVPESLFHASHILSWVISFFIAWAPGCTKARSPSSVEIFNEPGDCWLPWEKGGYPKYSFSVCLYIFTEKTILCNYIFRKIKPIIIKMWKVVVINETVAQNASFAACLTSRKRNG